MKKPKLYIVAGPNGAGKTTFAKQFLPRYAKCFEFVNADLIASGLSPLKPASAEIKAGRIMLKNIFDLANKRKDFAFETTLSGKTYVRLLTKLKQRGYEAHLFYLWLPNAELAVKRVSDRVKLGGHSVAKKDIIRRFSKSIENLFTIYWQLPGLTYIIDNSKFKPYLVAVKRGNNLKVLDAKLFNAIKNSL